MTPDPEQAFSPIVRPASIYFQQEQAANDLAREPPSERTMFFIYCRENRACNANTLMCISKIHFIISGGFDPDLDRTVFPLLKTCFASS